MALSTEERVKRLEDIAKKGKGWAQWHNVNWQKKRAEELRNGGMSGRQAKNQAWREAQTMDFSQFD
jgi:hypothetical protein